jgi:protein ImuA
MPLPSVQLPLAAAPQPSQAQAVSPLQPQLQPPQLQPPQSPAPSPESLHPSLWRGSQLARSGQPCLPTGHDALSAELPGGGWPTGTLVDLLVSQPGIGELRLLQPVLNALPPQRRIVLLQPPFIPQVASWSAWGLSSSQLLWLKPDRTADALWAAEQVLKNGSCGALLYWQPQIRPESLRRLHLAAQSADTLFFLFRPAKVAQDASPSPLRLLLHPAGDQVRIDIVKRRGPSHDRPLFVTLGAPSFGVKAPATVPATPLPATLAPAAPADRPAAMSATARATAPLTGLPVPSSIESDDALVDQRVPDAPQPRRVVPELV